MQPTNPRVFISYSHDNRAHCDRVLEFAQQLHRDGIAAELDQFHQEELLHWPRWCEEQMRTENADFVLCVCTAEYTRRVENRTAADVGKGVFWEGKLIYDELYDAKGNPRCVPVLLGGAKDSDIPRVLKNYTWFGLDDLGLSNTESGYSRLYRLLTQQAGVEATALVLVALPELERRTDFCRLLEDIRQDTQAILREQAEHGELLKRIAQSARDYRPCALHQLRRPPEHFTGRVEVLAELCAALREQAQVDGVVGLSAVNGMGGVGKTALGTMAAYTVLADFPDMQLFIELRTHSPTPVSAAQARDSVLQAVYPQDELPKNNDALWHRYQNLFYGPQTGRLLRTLVILDDVADDEQVEKLAPPPGCALLVTSRRHLRTGKTLHLDRLHRPEAIDLLQRLAHRLSSSDAERLAVLCGDLPIALYVAAGYLKTHPSKSPDAYLSELEKAGLNDLYITDHAFINLIFDYSFKQLADSHLKFLAALALIPGKFIVEEADTMIRAILPENKSSKKSVLPNTTDRLLCRETLHEFVCNNLIEYDGVSDTFFFHDILAKNVLKYLSKDDNRRASSKVKLILTKRSSKAAGKLADMVFRLLDLEMMGYYMDLLLLCQRQASYISILLSSLDREKKYVELFGYSSESTEYIYFYNLIKEKKQQIEYHAITCMESALNYKDQEHKPRAVIFLEGALMLFSVLEDPRAKEVKMKINKLRGNKVRVYLAWVLGFDYAEKFLKWLGSFGISDFSKAENTLGYKKFIGNHGIGCKSNKLLYLSIIYGEEILGIARKIGHQYYEALTLQNMALSYEMLGELAEATNHLKQAITVLQTIEVSNVDTLMETAEKCMDHYTKLMEMLTLALKPH